MNRIHALLVCFVLLLAGFFSACSSSSQDPLLRTVKISPPLKEPNYGSASLAPFNEEKLFQNLSNEFIFKGRIEKVDEVQISYNIGTKEDIHMVDQWLSVCYVKIESILYGDIPGIKDSIKVVSGQSTRLLAEDEFRLLEGQEYYFITFILSHNENVNIENDPLRIPEFGDVMAGTFSDLFPINDGMVSYRDWKFEGGKRSAVSSELIRDAEITASIDEEAFLSQFSNKIQEAMSRQAQDETAPLETTRQNDLG